MVTRSAAQELPEFEPVGQRFLLAAVRLPYGAMTCRANLERWARSAAGRTATLFAVIAAAYVVGAELAWHDFSSGLAFGYPPSGVDVAVLLLIALRRWPTPWSRWSARHPSAGSAQGGRRIWPPAGAWAGS